jgi:hypothetical protein
VKAGSVFGRRSASEDAEAQAEAQAAELEAAQGKGRATPKRKEAEALRKKRMAPPRNRKEASALRKERMKEHRVKQRAALAGGDDRYLPPRDQGPVKKFIRDYVDSHRTIGEFFLPVFIVMFVLVVVAPKNVQAASSFAWIVLLVVVAADAVRVLRGVKKAITERFGAAETHGIAMYTIMRSWQMRRLRLPKATVRPGSSI